jgi:hypothetical protein
MGKKTVYRSVLRVVIVSENAIPIEEIQYNLTDTLENFDDVGAHIVGVHIDIDNAELVGKNAVIELEKHASRPELFGMDAQGFEIEDPDYDYKAIDTFISNVDMDQ